MAVSTHLQIELSEYDSRIRTFIPDYEQMLDAAVAALRAAGRPVRRLLDLGIGSGQLHADGRAAVAADEDPPVLSEARRDLVNDRLVGEPRPERLHVRREGVAFLCQHRAGLAEAGRYTPEKGNRSKKVAQYRLSMYRQAPMFSGSSCTQRTGVPSA